MNSHILRLATDIPARKGGLVTVDTERHALDVDSAVVFGERRIERHAATLPAAKQRSLASGGVTKKEEFARVRGGGTLREAIEEAAHGSGTLLSGGE
eukprot:6458824-Prymnesium_polylepis.1